MSDEQKLVDMIVECNRLEVEWKRLVKELGEEVTESKGKVIVLAERATSVDARDVAASKAIADEVMAWVKAMARKQDTARGYRAECDRLRRAYVELAQEIKSGFKRQALPGVD